MAQSKRLPRKTLDQQIDERRQALGLSWGELEDKAGVTKKTMLHIRSGGDSYPKTIRNLEAALGWALGSIADIKDGKEPRVVDTDALLARPDFRWPAPTDDDPAVQLRAIRQRMGRQAFWLLIEQMRSEETTQSVESGSAPPASTPR